MTKYVFINAFIAYISLLEHANATSGVLKKSIVRYKIPVASFFDYF